MNDSRSSLAANLIAQIEFYPTSSNKPNLGVVLIPLEQGTQTKNKSFFLQSTTTYLHINRVFSAQDTSFIQWAKQREQKETVLEAVSTGISIGIPLEKHLYARVGLDFTKINSVFLLNKTFTEMGTINGIQRIIITTQNDTSVVMGPITEFRTISREKRAYNSFKQWELPILLGYNFEKNKLNLLAEGGVRLLWNRSWKGDIQDDREDIIDLATKDWYNKWGLSIQTGIGVGYAISPNVQINLGAQLRYPLTRFTKTNAPIKEDYYLYGGQLGLKWILF